ncbi:MAG: chloride channel protein [Bacteroidetes bacterium]|nr:chloride channel protein [Bacteroidota bacterium]MBL0066278.1 chloride channel protein [Bacteroidota bacterium]MBL0139069.1 chloride channel protein [Bacteroidota bacterium]
MKKYANTKRLLIMCSILIGLLSAMSAVVLKNGIHLIRLFIQLVVYHFSLEFLYILLPAIGIVLTTYYVQTFLKGNMGRGVSNILFNISRRSGNIPQDKVYSQMITSILTVGFGGSAGLEAPIASTGSAIGSVVARRFGFGTKERILLLACGAAAGISAIFNAPIAGVIFALEILLVDMPLPVVVPLLISSATAALFSRFIFSGQPFVLITNSWNASHIFYYLLFAVLCAFISIIGKKIYFAFEDLSNKYKAPYTKAIAGGLLLGIFIFLVPPLFGEGYDSVQQLLQNHAEFLRPNWLLPGAIGPWLMVVLAFLLVFLKVTATSITMGSGGNGGMFGSSLFMGAMFGFAYSRAINLLGFAELNEINFIVIGMAALMSGIIHAPLTAIFLIAEITSGYALLVPLMIVSSISFLITRFYNPYSVYTKKLVQQGNLPEANKDNVVLNHMKLSHYIEKNFNAVHPDQTLGDLIKAISVSKRNIFPVINEDGSLAGVILLDDIRSIMFSEEKYPVTFLKDLMISPPAILDIKDSMHEVMQTFEQCGAWNLPVVEDGKYIGFVSKSAIYSHYRDLLVKEAALPT